MSRAAAYLTIALCKAGQTDPEIVASSNILIPILGLALGISLSFAIMALMRLLIEIGGAFIDWYGGATLGVRILLSPAYFLAVLVVGGLVLLAIRGITDLVKAIIRG